MGPVEERPQGPSAHDDSASGASSRTMPGDDRNSAVYDSTAHRIDDALSELLIPSIAHLSEVANSDSPKGAHQSERGCGAGAASALPSTTPQASIASQHDISARDVTVDRTAPESSGGATITAAVKKLGTAIGATVCFSLTGVFNQAARGESADVAHYPDPFLYCVLRSSVASVVTYLKDRETLERSGIRRAFREIGGYGHLMCGLMAVNNLMWVAAYLLTDLASALVIAGAQPFVHSLYESVRTRTPPSTLRCAGLGFTAAALGTILWNQSTASAQYPYAEWGNLAAFAASMCFVTYMTINNRIVESAKERAVSPQDVAALQTLGSDAEKIQRERAFESMRAEAQQVAQARLQAVPFFSQVASVAAGAACFIPGVALGLFSGGFGLNPLNTVIMGTLHGVCAAGGLYLRTLATQTNSPSLVSLVSGAGIGLSPLFGYVLFGITVPQFALVAGGFAFCASLASVAEVRRVEVQRKARDRSERAS